VIETDQLQIFRSDRLVFEPSAADDFPGRRILLDDAPLCRVVPDPSDPRPLPTVVRRWIEAAAAPAGVR